MPWENTEQLNLAFLGQRPIHGFIGGLVLADQEITPAGDFRFARLLEQFGGFLKPVLFAHDLRQFHHDLLVIRLLREEVLQDFLGFL